MRREVDIYLAGLTPARRERLTDIIECFRTAMPGVDETMRYNMPAFEKDGNWVTVASQRQYLSIYFCDEALLNPIRIKHPSLDVGKGCVRIRDRQEIPLKDLARAFRAVMQRASTMHE